MATASTPLRIAILDDYLGSAQQLADWDALGPQVQVHALREHLGDAAAVVAALQPYQVLVAMRERTRFPAAVVEALPALRLLVSTGQQNAAIDLEACRRRGVAVRWANSAPSRGNSTAEMTWALILALHKQLPRQDASVRAGRWQVALTESLAGKVLGLMGLGRVGAAVARVGVAFGMDVQAWSPHLDAQRAAAAGARLVDKATLVADSDVLSLHVVLGEGTAGIVDRQALRSMKRTAYLVNTGRAGLLQPGALLEALTQGWIAGAGLDVFDTEPLPGDDPLCRLDNLVLSPHLGYVTRENYAAFYGNAVAQIREWMEAG